MSAPPDLRLVVERLQQPPFNLILTAIQLHDDIPYMQLIQIVSDVMAHIDESNTQSFHKGVDLRAESQEDTIARLTDFLRLLKCKDVNDSQSFRQALLNGDKMILLDILYFLIKDLETHQKRAYLAPFLATIEVPPEYLTEDVAELLAHVEELQDQFKNSHKLISGLRNNGNTAAVIKREIQQMEEEKQQVNNKISKIKKKVEEVPNHEIWVDAAKKLRQEQYNETTTTERIKEQKNQVAQLEKKLQASQQALKDAQSSFSNAGPETLLSKLQEEAKMNKYLALENLPKNIEETKRQIRDFQKNYGRCLHERARFTSH